MVFGDDAQGWLDPRAQLLGTMGNGMAYSPFSMVSQNPYAQYGVPVQTLQQPTVGMPQMQPTQVPVNPQNAWSLFSGSTNPYTSTGPSEEYQRQRALERGGERFGHGLADDQSYAPPMSPDPRPSPLSESGWVHDEPGWDTTGTRRGGPGTQPDWQKRLPPKRQRLEAEVGRGRGGIETWPEGKLDMRKLFSMKAPRYLQEELEEELSTLPYGPIYNRFTDESTPRPRYNPEMASPEKPYSIGDVIAKWLLESGGINLRGKWEEDNYEPGGSSEVGPFREGFASALPDVPPEALETYGGTWLEKYPDLIRSHRKNVIREHGGIKPSADVGEGKSRLDRVWPDDQVEMLWNYFYPKYLESGRYNK